MRAASAASAPAAGSEKRPAQVSIAMTHFLLLVLHHLHHSIRLPHMHGALQGISQRVCQAVSGGCQAMQDSIVNTASFMRSD